MSLLNGLKEQLKNPLADNNDEIEFALESDFEVALEKAIDVKLSPEDIAAILNGDDDIDDEEDNLDDDSDDIDRDTVKDLECCKEALEATMAEIGIDTAADDLDTDEDDLDLDPEEEDEIISEEALIAKCEALLEAAGMTDTNDTDMVADTGDASIPENTEDPTPDGDLDEECGKLEAECEALLAALESEETDCKPEVDKDPDATECSNSEMKVEECDNAACEKSEEPTEDNNVSVKVISEEDNPAIPTEGDEDEDEEPSLESILDSLLENPM